MKQLFKWDKPQNVKALGTTLNCTGSGWNRSETKYGQRCQKTKQSACARLQKRWTSYTDHMKLQAWIKHWQIMDVYVLAFAWYFLIFHSQFWVRIIFRKLNTSSRWAVFMCTQFRWASWFPEIHCPGNCMSGFWISREVGIWGLGMQKTWHREPL